MTLRVISFGGGVQSTAMLVLAAQGEILDVDVALFANVGDDSENPATIDYIRDVARPFAALAGIPIVEVARPPLPTLSPHTLLTHLRAYDGCQACGAEPEDDCYPACPSRNNTGGDLPIPMKLDPSHAPVQRSCTKHWKVLPLRRWLMAHGATVEDPALVMLGISVDEIERANTRRPEPIIDEVAFPLLDLGLTRSACRTIIAAAGLPVPPKSACWFCPFHSQRNWEERRRDEPALFDRAVELEDNLNRRRTRRNLQPVRFLPRGQRLGDLTEAQTPLFDRDGFAECDEGVCFV